MIWCPFTRSRDCAAPVVVLRAGARGSETASADVVPNPSNEGRQLADSADNGTMTATKGQGMEDGRTLHNAPADVGDADDVNAAIRATWYDVCRDFPQATTPLVAKRVAQEYDVPVSRVLDAFPASRDEGTRN